MEQVWDTVLKGRADTDREVRVDGGKVVLKDRADAVPGQESLRTSSCLRWRRRQRKCCG